MTGTLSPGLLILLCLLVGGGILGCLVLFASLKADLAEASRRATQQQEQLHGLMAAAEAERTRIEERLQRLEQRRANPPQPAPVPAPVSLNRRSQAISRARMGEAPEQIAKVLEMPRGEVKLLLKVQELLARTDTAS